MRCSALLWGRRTVKKVFSLPNDVPYFLCVFGIELLIITTDEARVKSVFFIEHSTIVILVELSYYCTVSLLCFGAAVSA